MNPKTYNDTLMDEKGREVWWKCMDRIEKLLDSSDAIPADVLNALGVSAEAAAAYAQDRDTDDEPERH
jgi:hypothetical protein